MTGPSGPGFPPLFACAARVIVMATPVQRNQSSYVSVIADAHAKAFRVMLLKRRLVRPLKYPPSSVVV